MMADTRYTHPPYFTDNLIFEKRVIYILLNSAPNGAKIPPLGAKSAIFDSNGVRKFPLGAGLMKKGKKDLESGLSQ